MAPEDVLGLVAEQAQEVVVGLQHMALQVELDHRLGTIDRTELARGIEPRELLLGDVLGHDQHFLQGAVDAGDRAARRGKPDLAPTRRAPAECALRHASGPQALPHRLVVGTAEVFLEQDAAFMSSDQIL